MQTINKTRFEHNEPSDNEFRVPPGVISVSQTEKQLFLKFDLHNSSGIISSLECEKS